MIPFFSLFMHFSISILTVGHMHTNLVLLNKCSTILSCRATTRRQAVTVRKCPWSVVYCSHYMSDYLAITKWLHIWLKAWFSMSVLSFSLYYFQAVLCNVCLLRHSQRLLPTLCCPYSPGMQEKPRLISTSCRFCVFVCSCKYGIARKEICFWLVLIFSNFIIKFLGDRGMNIYLYAFMVKETSKAFGH